jgi:protein-S-isoprenylcysteine O-methyltransferase Ste14/membrane-associated phospholipid phosphatase
MNPPPTCFGRRWRAICLVSALAFLALAVTISLAGVWLGERVAYQWIVGLTDHPQVVAVFRRITRIGSESFLLPALTLLLIALPGRLLRRWWLWLAIMLAVPCLEQNFKLLVARARPERASFGFPSGHVAEAAAFFTLLAYFADTLFQRITAKVAVWTTAVLIIVLVAVSRVVLRAHWPLDTVGGAALGIACAAAAAWWHEALLVADGPDALKARLDLQRWIYRWQNVLPIPLLAVLLLKAPSFPDEGLLDALCDVVGAGLMCGGVLLRLWAVGHAGPGVTSTTLQAVRLATSGPYAYVRHPVHVAHFLIGSGFVVLAENWPGVIVLPAALCLLYRIVIPVEEAFLRDRFGAAYDDYSRRVPRWLPARSTAFDPSGHFSWRALRDESVPALAVVGLGVLAEIRSLLPHLFD